MTTMRTLILVTAVVACGGKKAADKPAPKPDPTPVVEKKEEPPPPPVEKAPPPPKVWHAKAGLDPVKGAKQKAAAITFAQEEGKSASASAAFDGLKPGKYHLVVHEAKACGANATKAGKALEASVDFEVKKGTPGAIDDSNAAVMLGGDDSMIGHAVVLHDDAKGKPGKALACGVISAIEDEDDAAKKE